MSRRRTGLSSADVRKRKATLAARDGAWCAYCWHLFADLRQATIDHVVPYCLYRTWRLEATVLACEPCNSAKADRLPLSLALLLTARHGSPDGSADSAPDGSGTHPASGRVLTLADWLLLARLAAAYESADSLADRTPQQSAPDLRDAVRHTAYRAPADRALTAAADRTAVGGSWESTSGNDTLREAA